MSHKPAPPQQINRASTAQLSHISVAFALAAIFAIGTLVRFLCLGWDGFSGLHPDERHMVFAVSDSIELLRKSRFVEPHWIATWFSPDANPFSPRRADFFYVYGDLPHVMATGATYALGVDGWPTRILLGRILVASLDSLAILAVFATARLCNMNAMGALAAAFLYAALPLALQHAGFFTVDGPGTFFAALFLMAISGWANGAGRAWCIVAGLALAAATASKVSFAAIAALIPIAFAITIAPAKHRSRAFATGLLDTAGMLVIACVGFRIINFSAFAGPGFLDANLSQLWLQQLQSLTQTMVHPAGVPSGWQWTLPGVHLAAFRDLILWGFGPATILLALVGLGAVVAQAVWRRQIDSLFLSIALVLLVAGLLAIHSVPAVRYALPAAPALAVLGGHGFATLVAAPKHFRPWSLVTALTLLVLVFGWGWAMTELHIRPNTRVQASLWLEKNMWPGAAIANETDWDDALPVRIVRGPDYAMRGGFTENAFKAVNLRLTDPDEPAKAGRIAAALAQADVVVVSSDRQLRTMTALSTRFPLTTAYYDALLRGDLCFAEAARFQRGFPVFGLPLDDSSAQEIWRVYDHPPVWIFRKQSCFDEARVRSLLEGALKSP